MKLNRRILDQLVHDIGSKAIRPADDPCVDSILDRRASKGGGEAAQPRGRLVVCILSKGRPHRLQVLQRGEPVRRAARRYVTAFAASVGLRRRNHFFSAGVSVQEKYKAAADPLNLCKPFQGGPSLSCEKVVIGGPTGKKRTVSTLAARGESRLRRVFPGGVAEEFGQLRQAPAIEWRRTPRDQGLNNSQIAIRSTGF